MNASDRPLDATEQWMVKSNLKTIADGEPAETIINTLKANGYLRVAAGVEAELLRRQDRTKGTKGHLIFHPSKDKFVFRVYNPQNKGEYTDYDLCVDDLAITIDDNYTSFVTGEQNKIVYTTTIRNET
jgi:hypothetical protein